VLIFGIELFGIDFPGTYFVLLVTVMLSALCRFLEKPKPLPTQEIFDWPMTISRKRRRKPQAKE
jgi:hypothetical protein